MTNIDGKELTFSKHGIDYRIACWECQIKYERFMDTMDEIRNIDPENKGILSLGDT